MVELEEKIQSEEEFLEDCMTIFEAVYYLNTGFSVLDYYAITNVNIKELFAKYKSLRKTHPKYNVSNGCIYKFNTYISDIDTYLKYSSENVRKKLLRNKVVIDGIELNTDLIKKIYSELNKKGYKNTTFYGSELNLPYGLIYDASIEVLKNSGDFSVLDKTIVLENLKARIKAKKIEMENKGIRTISFVHNS